MKFSKMTVEEFLAITKAEVKFADRGLVLIQGINADDTSADSNGSGKSSLADALCWCLYGTTARGVSGDDVINDAAGKGTRACVEIEDGPDAYRIARHRKHKDGKNSLQVRKFNDQTKMFDIDLTKGTDKLTQDVVNKILGASYEVFKGAIYAGQEQMPDLPAMTDKQLKILIEEAAGVTLLEEAYKEARERLGKKKAEYDQVAASIAQCDQRKAWITHQLTQEIASRDGWTNTQRLKISADKSEIRNKVDQIKVLDAQIGAVDFAGLQKAIAECDAKIAAVSQEGQQHAALVKEAAQAQTQLVAATNNVANANRLLSRFQAELANVQHKIGCPCDECGRPMTEAELGAAKKAAGDRVEEANMELADAKKKVAAATKLVEETEVAAKAFQSKMTDTSQVSAERAQKQAQLSAGELLKQKRAQLAIAAKTLGEGVKTLSAAVNPFEANIAECHKQLEAADKAGKDLQDKLNEVMKAMEIAEAVTKVFSPAGVRAHILDEVTPFLNQQTAKYLAILSDGNISANWTTLVKNAKGELREKFSIEVEKKSGSKSFAGLSGGEKRKVRIAAALALQDLVATRATKPIELFIGDEIDDALDPAGLERLMQILEDKAKERGSVFVISHNSLRDWISNIVQVEMKGGKTTVTEVTA